MTKLWQMSKKRDYFYRRAKEQKLRSRAAFKLIQLNRRYGLFRDGDVIVDLGAAPGGWLQVARESVGEKGFVVGVDLQRISELPYKNVLTLVADITRPETREVIKSKLPRAADAVISDASPSLSGIKDVDHARSMDLVNSSLRIAAYLLAPGGNLLVKVFQGETFNDFLKKLRKFFDFVKASKPTASRKGSAEVYVIAKGFRPDLLARLDQDLL